MAHDAHEAHDHEQLHPEQLDEQPSDLPISFAGTDRAEILRLAAAAWRLYADAEDGIWYAPTAGLAMVGDEDDWEQLAESRQIEEEADVWEGDDARSIAFTPDDVHEVLALVRSRSPEAEQLHSRFHWGDPPTGTAGIAVDLGQPLTLLGAADALEYTSRKDGDVVPYRHEFGEESGQAPALYATADGRALVITGGGMRVEEAGIVD